MLEKIHSAPQQEASIWYSNEHYASGSGTSAAAVHCNTFAWNQNGIYWTYSPPLEMRNNNFNGNTSYGLYYTGSALLNAENNWWGNVNGPTSGGGSTYGNVDRLKKNHWCLMP